MAEKEEFATELTEAEQAEIDRRTATRAAVVYEAVRQEGETELKRSSMALGWSGLAAGLSMGFSLVAEGLIRSHLPEAQWTPLLAKLGYSLGFLIVILGRQQLFTENTLTPIIPLLARKDWDCLKNVLRLWAVVLVANLLGVLIFVAVLAHTDVFSAEAKDAFVPLGTAAVRPDFGTILLKAIFAGWLIALMVWLLPGAETARVPIIIILTYIVGLGELSHIIAGSAQTLYLVVTGRLGIGPYLGLYLVPTLVGNIIGGVSLVAALNHAQVVAGETRGSEK